MLEHSLGIEVQIWSLRRFRVRDLRLRLQTYPPTNSAELLGLGTVTVREHVLVELNS